MSATIVTLERGCDGLDFFIKGGREHGIPIIITHVVPGGRAERSGAIGVGTQILAVNSTSLAGASHAEAVAALSGAGPRVTLHVRENSLIKRALEDQAATAALEAASPSAADSLSSAGAAAATETITSTHPGHVVDVTPLEGSSTILALPAPAATTTPTLQLSPRQARRLPQLTDRESNTSSGAGIGNGALVSVVGSGGSSRELSITSTPEVDGSCDEPIVIEHTAPPVVEHTAFDTATVTTTTTTHTNSSNSSSNAHAAAIEVEDTAVVNKSGTRLNLDNLRAQAEQQRRRDLEGADLTQLRSVLPSGSHVRERAAARATAVLSSRQEQQRRHQHQSSASAKTNTPPLPEGWVERVDAKTGRTFYANLIGRTTTWVRPDAAVLKPIVPANLDDVDWGTLPPGWARAEDSAGDTYYINHLERTTSWESPRVYMGRKQLEQLTTVTRLHQLRISAQEGRLQATRAQVTARHSNLEELRAQRRQLTDCASGDTMTTETDQARLNGQIDVLSDQINREVSRIMEATRANESEMSSLGEDRLRVAAVEQLRKEAHQRLVGKTPDSARRAHRLASRLAQLQARVESQARELIRVLTLVDDLRYDLFHAAARASEYVAAAPSLNHASPGVAAPVYADENGLLKTDVQLVLDAAVLEHTTLPALVDYRQRAERLLTQLTINERRVQEFAAEASKPPTWMTSLLEEFGNAALAKAVRAVQHLTLPVAIEAKVHLACTGSAARAKAVATEEGWGWDTNAASL